MKYSILTCIFNNYEILKDPEETNPDVEYICVTNTDNLRSDIWKIIYRPDILNFLYVKHHPFEFCTNDNIVWMDASYQITKDFSNDIMYEFINSDKELMISLHNIRYNIYEELIYWTLLDRLDVSLANAFFNFLIKNKYTGHGTLFQTSVMFMKKNNFVQTVFHNVSILDDIFKTDTIFYRDDQTFISYIIDKYYYKYPNIVLMDFAYTCDNKYFHWCHHGTNNKHSELSYHNICWGEPQPLLYKIRKT